MLISRAPKISIGKGLLRIINNKRLSTEVLREGTRSHIHFKLTPTPHPLGVPKIAYEVDDMVAGDHTGRQQNHIWSKSELQEKMSTLYHHTPQSISDRVTHACVSTVHCKLLCPIIRYFVI